MATGRGVGILISGLLLPSATLLRGQAGQEPRVENFHFAGTTLGGSTIDQEVLRKHVVIVDLWGTWCGPCRQAVPVLVDLYKKYKQHGLEIVGFCYAANGAAEDAATVRRFAAEQGVTYDLLPGDPSVRDQVPDFSGYPTMLLFARDVHSERVHVGFAADLAEQLEAWVRRSLALEQETPAAEAREEVPAGRVFEPGNADRAFELDGEDLGGAHFSMADWHDKPLLLALTSSWDQEAPRTVKFLQAMQLQFPTIRVVGWYVERQADQTERCATARAFVAAHPVTFTTFATGLKAARERVHQFSSLPTLLLFDGTGRLVARESGISDEIEQRLTGRVTKLGQ